MEVQTLHIFNPEHDIALASNLANFTAPHAGRQLRSDLGFLPVLWADESDAVLVDNVEVAARTCQRLCRKMGKTPCRFVDKSQLSHLDISRVEPWGWDLAMRALLKRSGVGERLLPTDGQLERIRLLSHRRTSAQLLPLLQTDGTIGEAYECTTTEQVAALKEQYGQVVVKAPWSSSGRGVRFDENAAWVSNVIARQGSVMVEPYYNKVKDFGMEFERDKDGEVRYLGLSLFHTKNGAYIGNLLATENTKREQISRYISTELLDKIKQNIIENVRLDDYVGPFGIDMMIVNADGKSKMNDGRCLLHPCVELNLRRTMGHVALSMTPIDDDICKVMRIEQMHLRIHRI